MILHHHSEDVGYEGATKPVPQEDPLFSRVRMISPMEMDHAFVQAAWNDLADPQKMEQWKRLGMPKLVNNF